MILDGDRVQLDADGRQGVVLWRYVTLIVRLDDGATVTVSQTDVTEAPC
ncbi:hypothetical protein [Xylanimonas allomyrinae]|nr:hypothetical protein [Xylanimonas allomyrinae]